MSLTMNMVGGGGLSNSRAIIVARVPSGSTVTATKGAVTLTPTLWVTGADASRSAAIFFISASLFDSTNPWTISATDGTNTASTDVIVTANKEYEVNLWFGVIYVNDGSLLTGKTITQTSTKYGGASTISIDTSNPVNFSFYHGYGVYLNPVNITDYNTLTIESKLLTNNLSWAYFGLSSDTKWYDNAATNMLVSKRVTAGYARTVDTFNIAGLTGTYYIKYYGWGEATATATLYNVYLSI